MLLCGVAAAAGNHSRTRSASPRPGNPAAGWHVHADAERRLSLADERSRAHGAGNSAPFAGGRGGLRRIFQDDDADVPVRETNPEHDSAGPDDAPTERPDAAQFS